MAASMMVPLVAHRSYNMRVTDAYFAPYSNQVYPDLASMNDALLAYLPYANRTNYIAILYSALETSTQRQALLSLKLKAANINYRLYPFEWVNGTDIDESLMLGNVLTKLKEEGFRTVVVMMEFARPELQMIADAADTVGINTDDYFWIYAGGIDISAFSLPPVDLNTKSLRFLAGAALLAPLEGFHLDPVDDPFAKSWRSQNNSLDLNTFNPIEEGNPGYFNAPSDYFRRFPPESGSGFMYDAVMSIGIGACLADLFPYSAGNQHLNGIRSVNFTGATGRIQFGTGPYTPGARKSSNTKFGVVNLFHRFAQSDESEWRGYLSGNDPSVSVKRTLC